MDKIDLRYQITIFGNFDDITPSVDTIKFFLDSFSERNLIPNQYHEVSIDAATGTSVNGNRLSLTSTDQSWNVRFSYDRMDVILTNANVGVTEMVDKPSFIENFKTIFETISSKFPKKAKRIGYICQYLITDIDLTTVINSFMNRTDFYNNSPSIEFNNKIVNRATISVPEEEFINVSSELRWLKTNLKKENQNTFFEGLLYATDVNTIPENNEYRFNKEKINDVLEESLKISDQLDSEYLSVLNQN